MPIVQYSSRKCGGKQINHKFQIENKRPKLAIITINDNSIFLLTIMLTNIGFKTQIRLSSEPRTPENCWLKNDNFPEWISVE